MNRPRRSSSISPQEDQFSWMENLQRDISPDLLPGLPSSSITDAQEDQRSHPERSRIGTDESYDRLTGLPRDIYRNIVSRLPIMSLSQFRFVCKGWRQIAKDPLLKTMRLQFILHCDCPIQNQLYYLEFDSINNGFSKAVAKITIPFRSVKLSVNVLGSCNGLLCLSDSSSAMYICNPFTGDYRKLPDIRRYIYSGVAFGFGFLAKTKEYKVIRIEDYELRGGKHIKSECHVLTVGEGGWRTIRDAEVGLDKVASEALVSGKFHWLIRRRHPSIVSFDLEYERFKRVQPPPVSVYEREYSLAVLRDCLSAVCRRNCQVEVWVMKDYDVEESWIKEFVIGQHIPAGLCASSGVNKKLVNAGPLRVICLLQNSKILLEYKKMFLVLYDAEKKEFEDLTIEGLPQWFRTVVHMGSLVSISEALPQCKDQQIREAVDAPLLDRIFFQKKQRRGLLHRNEQ